jgi:hypothetical protein
MPSFRGTFSRILPIGILFLATVSAQAQNAGAVTGTVSDPTGAVIPGATVNLNNASSGLDRSTITDDQGHFTFTNVPFNPYKVTVTANGFGVLKQSTEIRSMVGVSLKLVLQIAAADSTVTVEASGDLVEDDPTFHTDVDRDMFIKVPMESQSSSLSSLVQATTPGVSADSNGLFHGLGDHASNSFSVDGQSITDQQSKVFSNQLPPTPFSPLKSSAARPQPSTAAKPAWSSWPPRALDWVVTKPPAASTAPTEHSDHPPPASTSRGRQELGQLHRSRWPQFRPLP